MNKNTKFIFVTGGVVSSLGKVRPMAVAEKPQRELASRLRGGARGVRDIDLEIRARRLLLRQVDVGHKPVGRIFGGHGRGLREPRPGRIPCHVRFVPAVGSPRRNAQDAVSRRHLVVVRHAEPHVGRILQAGHVKQHHAVLHLVAIAPDLHVGSVSPAVERLRLVAFVVVRDEGFLQRLARNGGGGLRRRDQQARTPRRIRIIPRIEYEEP